jgi:predicted GNAT family N-acyltransferase
MIEPLASSHDTAPFRCGKHSLDLYLKRYALGNQRDDLGRTFIALEPGGVRVWGYYTLASSKVAKADMPDAEREQLGVTYPIPVILLGRLAVDTAVRGRGLGKLLLLDALRRAERLASSQLGARGVEVDALDNEAKAFYTHFGFVALADNNRHLYVSMNVIRRLRLQ